jgi:hypothetical protein
MKNIFVILLFLITTTSYSQSEKDCEETDDLASLSLDLNSPCSRGLSPQKIQHELSILNKNNSSVVEFCEKCKEPKIKADENVSSSKYNHIENKKQFTKATLNELRKNLSSTMIDLMSLRSTFSLNFKPNEVMASCNMTQLATTKCKGGKSLQELIKETIGNDDSFKNIQTQMGYEIANVLTPPPYKGEGLLKRSVDLKCGISDNEVLHAKMKYFESLITPDMIKELKKLNLETKEDVLSQLSGPNAKILKQASEHPMIRSILKDTTNFKGFLDSFKGDITNEKIIENLFSSSNSEALAKNISNRCKTSFETIKNTLCSPEFEKGNLKFDNFEAMKMKMNTGQDILVENREENLFSFCEGIKSNLANPLLFSSVNKTLSQDLSPQLSRADYKSVSKEYYDTAFDTPRKFICPLLETQECDSKLMNCAISKFLKAARVKDSPQAQLLASHDPNVDKILGSLIGPEPVVDEKTKTFLIDQGILPKADGTIVEAPNNQIRNPSNYTSSVKNFESGNSAPPLQNKQIQNSKVAKEEPDNEWTGADIERNDDSDGENATGNKKLKKNKKVAGDDSEEDEDDNNDKFKDKFKKRLDNLKKRATGKNANPTQETEQSSPNNTFGQTSSGGGVSNYQGDPALGNDLGGGASTQGNTSGAALGPAKTEKEKAAATMKSINDAKLNANRKPAEDDKVKNTTIALTKTTAGLNQIEIKVPDESILHENTPELERKIKDYLDESGQSLQGAKSGEAYFVKLGAYKIKVAINDHGVYVAKCEVECPNLSPEYLKFLSKYFTKIKKGGNIRERLKNIFNKKNPSDPKDSENLE